MYSETLRSTLGRFLLKKGEAVWYDWYNFPNGARWIVRYKGKYYRITHDGTGNQFFCSHAPIEITEEEAKEILSKHEEAWQEAQHLFGWEDLDTYFEQKLSSQ